MKTFLDIPNIDTNRISFYFNWDNENHVTFYLNNEDKFKEHDCLMRISNKGQYIIFNNKRYYCPWRTQRNYS